MKIDAPLSLSAAGIAATLAVVLGAAPPPSDKGPAPLPETVWRPDRIEPESVERICENTTAAEYLPATVSYVPESDAVPSPLDVLGRVAGEAGELTKVAAVNDYFRRLAGASPRVDVRTLGTSEEGREMLLAVVASEENLARLDPLLEITARLADPRSLPEEAMEALLGEGRVVYHLLGGLHSPETGSPEMLMELAYRLAVSERPEIRLIRENVVVLITPVVETDGRDRVVEWYERHLRSRDLSWGDLQEFPDVPYWGHYVFHDNNRDGIQMTLALTRAVRDAFVAFHPQVLHDLHESVPLLYISTGHGPYSRAVDPVTVSEWSQFALHEAGALQSRGVPGVWTWGFWDGWWPGYLFSIANNRNAVGRFYETFGNSHPGTFVRDLKEEEFAGRPVTEIQWYRPWPPDRRVRWSLRNNVNLMQAGVLEALRYAALHREELLRNFWIKGNRAVEKGREEAPHAWVFPEGQRDPGRLAYLLNRLRDQGIEVHRLDAAFEIADTSWPAGSAIVRMDQPYRNAAQNFLEEQRFPPDEPNPPYDDVAWTFPLLYGVTARRIDDPRILDAAMTPVTGEVRPTGSVMGSGEVFLLADTGQTSLLPARLEFGAHAVAAAETAFAVGRERYPAGSWIVTAPRAVVEEIATRHGLRFRGAGRAPEVPSHPVDLPRLAVLHTWTATQDCGWTRYTLDRTGVPYTLINPDDLRAGNLRDRFDVILFPPSYGSFASMVNGPESKFGPVTYTTTPEFPSHGIPDGSEDISRGMGFEGLLRLREFVERGGVFVAAGSSVVLPVEAGFTRNVTQSRGPGLQSPGSVLRAKVLRPLHPIAYGYEETCTAFRRNGPVLEVPARYRHWTVVQFGQKDPDEDDAEEKGADPPGMGSGGGDGPAAARAGRGGGKLVLSGYRKGDSALDGKPAVLDVPLGDGHVVLFAFNPLHRHLNHAEFRYLFNVILNWNDLPAGNPFGVERRPE